MKYILSTFFENFKTNIDIKNKYATLINFDGIQGSFPFEIFHGWYNNIRYEELAVYDDLIGIIQDYSMLAKTVYIDMGNIILKETDFFNCFENVILTEYANNKNFFFEIADINLLEYLIKNYPNIQIILHQNFTMYHTEKQIKDILENYYNIKGIIITNINPCININNTYKIFLLHFNKCEFCKMFQNCLEIDMQLRLEYSEKSAFINCDAYNYFSFEDIINQIYNAKQTYNCETILLDTICMNKSEFENDYILQLFKLITEKDNFYDLL